MSGTGATSWRLAAQAATRQREALAARVRRQVLAVLREAKAPLSVATIALLAQISYGRARRALETLAALRVVVAAGAANNRRYQLVGPGIGEMAGDPASESAVAAYAGTLPATARPGRAA